jgi:hypothetical protein
MTYADEDLAIQLSFAQWAADSNNRIRVYLATNSTNTGAVVFNQTASGTNEFVSSTNVYSPGINAPYNLASRHGSTFLNGAVDGTALTADTTPVALPDLSATNLQLAFNYMGCLKLFRMWDQDLGDTGIAAASEGEPSSYLLWDATADTYVSRTY